MYINRYSESSCEKIILRYEIINLSEFEKDKKKVTTINHRHSISCNVNKYASGMFDYHQDENLAESKCLNILEDEVWLTVKYTN